MVEHRLPKPNVAGSSPVFRSIKTLARRGLLFYEEVFLFYKKHGKVTVVLCHMSAVSEWKNTVV